jgi:multisubunit Na+/H+ antiporter MnhB subunit
MMIIRSFYYDLMSDISLFFNWLCREIDALLANGYYLLFLISAMIFLLQYGVPLIVDYFVENNDYEQ